jgi:hypothetical protein
MTMPTELWVRAGLNDHDIVEEVLGPGNGSILPLRTRRVIGGVVADAHVVAKRPELASTAARAGIPFAVDPLTHLLPEPLRESDIWAQLPYANHEPVPFSTFDQPSRRQELVRDVIEFELAGGATVLVPPYFYCPSPESPEFRTTLKMATEAAEFLEEEGINLPIQIVICGQLKAFAAAQPWKPILDSLKVVMTESSIDRLAICLSPAGSPSDSFAKVSKYFQTLSSLASVAARATVWRQGVYGPSLVAAGLTGYEAGIGSSEQTNIAASLRSRRPRADGTKKNGGAGPGIFLEPLGRSVPTVVGQSLLGDLAMRAKLMCDDETCCPNGVADTLDRRRTHALRTRARVVADLDSIPQTEWKLQKVENHARLAATLAEQANKVLKKDGLKQRLGTKGMDSLARLLEYLRTSTGESAAAGSADK